MSRKFCLVTGKRSYTSRKKALTGMNGQRSMVRRGYGHRQSSTSGPVAVYRCEFCGAWHMTSQEHR